MSEIKHAIADDGTVCQNGLNLNDMVYFILTPDGEKAIRDFDARVSSLMPPFLKGYSWFSHHTPLDGKGTRCDQLWHLFEMLGPSMCIGSQLLVDNQLWITPPKGCESSRPRGYWDALEASLKGAGIEPGQAEE